jgi:hypothetical protein
MVACIDFFEMSEICRPKFIVRHTTKTQFYRYAHSVRPKTFAQVVLRSAFCERDVSVKMAPPRVVNCDWI